MLKAKLKVDLKGLQKLKKKDMNRILRKALRAAVVPAKKEMKARVPSKTKALKMSIADKIKVNKASYAMVGPKNNYQKVVGNVTKKPAKYGHLVDRGSKHNKPRRFVSASLKASQPQFEKIMNKIVSEELAK